MALATGVYGPGEKTLTQTQTPSTNWGAVSIGTSVAGAISSVYAGKVAGYGYEMQAATRRVQAQQAVSAAKMTNLRLTQNYNDIAAMNAVMGATSGRSFASGSVQAIMAADRDKLSWDIEYSTLSGEIGKIGTEADAMGYESAAKQQRLAGIQKGLLSGLETYAKYKQVG